MYPAPEENARARAEMYSWLSAVLYFPTEEMLRRDFLLPLEDFSRTVGTPDIRQEIISLERFIAAKPELQSLTMEYCRLFYGPGPLEAPPYESVYRDGYRLMGDSTLEAIRMYAEEGLHVVDSFKDMPDHASVEMEFMAHLCGQEARAWEDSDETAAASYRAKQLAFLDGKLSRWIPPMCDLVTRMTRSDFYRSVATIARALVHAEGSRLRDGTPPRCESSASPTNA